MSGDELREEHVRGLLAKAAEDEAVVDEVLGSSRVSDDIVGFHCQQAAEKLLKALAAACGLAYRRTHDLDELAYLLQEAGVTMPTGLEGIGDLTEYAVERRYEQSPCTPRALDRPAARGLVRQLRAWVEQQIDGVG